MDVEIQVQAAVVHVDTPDPIVYIHPPLSVYFGLKLSDIWISSADIFSIGCPVRAPAVSRSNLYVSEHINYPGSFKLSTQGSCI